MKKGVSKLGLMDIITEGKKLWAEHGEEISAVAGKLVPSAKKGELKGGQLSQIVQIAQQVAGDVMADVKGEQDEVMDSSSVSTLDLNENANSSVQTKGDKLIVIETKDPEDTYYEDMLATLGQAAKDGLKSPKAAMEALRVLMQCADNTVNYCAEQETKRVEILAKRDAVIGQINAVTAMVRDYLDRTFDERSKIFAKQFEVLDIALKEGNTELLSATLNGINSLAASSPFKNLADIQQVQQSLSAGTEWDI